MWGGVGRGKTWLMDLFYQSLPGERKQRLHFHRFMLRVHEEITTLQGHIDPLDTVPYQHQTLQTTPYVEYSVIAATLRKKEQHKTGTKSHARRQSSESTTKNKGSDEANII